MPNVPDLFLFFILLPFLAGAQPDSLRPVLAADSFPAPDSVYVETGIASWYGKKAEGRMTASGEIFHADSMTAAHKTLPMGTLVRVTNLRNDSVVIVKINDRLPKSSTKRCIDLSSGAAKKLDFLRTGTTPVRVEVIGTAPLHRRKRR